MKIEYAPAASKQFARLDKPIQRRIKKYMSEIAILDNPRARGRDLLQIYQGCGGTALAITAFLCRIRDDKLIITVIEIEHRSTVY